MPHYLVKAKPKHSQLPELYELLQEGEIKRHRPFGDTLHSSLLNAKADPETGYAYWEEEDYCSPPLAMEREAVLDRFFKEIEWESIERDEGWNKIESMPGLWSVTDQTNKK